MKGNNFLILTCQDECYGTLRHFAYALARSLMKYGHTVYTTDGKYGGLLTVNEIKEIQWTAIVGFQTLVLESDLIVGLPGKKIQFCFDHPSYFQHGFRDYNKEMYLLYLDEYYVQYAKKYRRSENIFFMPPGSEMHIENIENKREMDVVFIGAYYEDRMYENHDEVANAYYNYMLCHPENTFEGGLQEFLLELGVEVSDFQMDALLMQYNEVCHNVFRFYKQKVIDAILDAGIKIHVFGETWNSYVGRNTQNLILHPAVDAQEAYMVWQNAKIGLNIMSWHKGGMTERVADIMMSGALCVSDETTYLRDNYLDGKEMVLYTLKEIERLPSLITYYLENEERRKEVAEKGRKKALQLETWDERAKSILHLIGVL